MSQIAKNDKHLMLFSGRAYPELAQEVARIMETELVPTLMLISGSPSTPLVTTLARLSSLMYWSESSSISILTRSRWVSRSMLTHQPAGPYQRTSR